MNLEMPDIDPRVLKVAGGFEELLKDRLFRSALDALSADVLDRCNTFLSEHRGSLLKHMSADDADLIVSAVVGWILGMPAGEKQADGRVHEAYQHNVIAAFVSAWSAENSARALRVIRTAAQ